MLSAHLTSFLKSVTHGSASSSRFIEAVNCELSDLSMEQNPPIAQSLLDHLNSLQFSCVPFAALRDYAIDCLWLPDLKPTVDACLDNPLCAGFPLSFHTNEFNPVDYVVQLRGRIQKLISATPEDHSDTTLLLSSSAVCDEVVQKINFAVKETQRRRQIEMVESLFANRIHLSSDPNRHLLKVGRLGVIQRKLMLKDEQVIMFRFHLFSDCLMWAQEDPSATGNGRTPLRFQATIPLEGLTVTSCPDRSIASDFIFILEASNRFVICATTVVQRNEWFLSLIDAIISRKCALAMGTTPSSDPNLALRRNFLLD